MVSRSILARNISIPKAVLVLLALVLAGVVFAGWPSPAEADTTFTVNKTGDAGDRMINGVCDSSRLRGKQCTLRAAIEEANLTPGADTINFNIGGTASVKTISPSRPLPQISDTLTINGYTQRGSRPNTLEEGNDAVLKVQLNGANAGGANGLEIVGASNTTIKGLVINRFEGAGGEGNGIFIENASNNKIEGNFIGTTVDGRGDLGNGWGGVWISNAANNTIGGTEPAMPNVISGNGTNGILIIGSTATGNKIEGNYIGTDPDLGRIHLGNGWDGVSISNAPNNTIGGTASGAGNLIANHDFGAGIVIAGTTATGNRVLSNQIFQNAELGIDLESSGVTANDTGDPDTGGNNVQNFPQHLSATRSTLTGITTIEGTLFSNGSQNYIIQCFVTDGSIAGSYGEGKIPAGEDTTVTTDSNGVAGFTCESPVPHASETVTATATNTATGDTSEFSQNVAVDSRG